MVDRGVDLRINQLASASIVRQFGPATLTALAETATLRRFAENTTLSRLGDVPSFIYVIHSRNNPAKRSAFRRSGMHLLGSGSRRGVRPEQFLRHPTRHHECRLTRGKRCPANRRRFRELSFRKISGAHTQGDPFLLPSGAGCAGARNRRYCPYPIRPIGEHDPEDYRRAAELVGFGCGTAVSPCFPNRPRRDGSSLSRESESLPARMGTAGFSSIRSRLADNPRPRRVEMHRSRYGWYRVPQNSRHRNSLPVRPLH
jgi:hypothetical protein